MARQKISKKFYTPKDVKYRFRWTFLEVLRKEYESKVIKLEEALPLYSEVKAHPLWKLTPLGSKTGGWGEFEDESRNFLEPLSNNFIDLCDKKKKKLPPYDELLSAVRHWAGTLGLDKTPWIYEVAFLLLECSSKPLPDGKKTLLGIEFNIKPKRHRIIGTIHIRANISGGLWHLPLDRLPDVPEFPMYLPKDDMDDGDSYSKMMHNMVDKYVRDSRVAFKKLGFIQFPEKNAIERHCKWLSWYCIEGLGWEAIANREFELTNKNVSHLSVRKAILGSKKQKVPGMAELCSIPVT